MLNVLYYMFVAGLVLMTWRVRPYVRAAVVAKFVTGHDPADNPLASHLYDHLARRPK
jgi:hypothetical protein